MIARRKFSDAAALLRRAEQIDRQNFAPDIRASVSTSSTKASPPPDASTIARPRVLYKKSEAILEKALPPNHPEIGNVLARLANVYRVEGRLDESEALVSPRD